MSNEDFWMQAYLTALDNAMKMIAIHNEPSFTFHGYQRLSLSSVSLYAEMVANQSLETFKNTFNS